MKKHYLINPTWRCHNAGVCRYCWVNQTVRERPELYHAAERPLIDWAVAIERDTPDVIDIAGGEPLLIPWLGALIQAFPQVSFGLSTNGLALRNLRRLVQMGLRNVVAVNVSYHPDAARVDPEYDTKWKTAITTILNAGGHPHTNVVDAFDNVDRAEHIRRWLHSVGVRCVVSPEEPMGTLGTLRDTGLICEGGVNHLTIAPDGTAWPCLTTLRSPYWADLSLGNWLDNTIDLSRKPQPCHLDCADYYILPQQHVAGDMWGIEARPWEGTE